MLGGFAEMLRTLRDAGIAGREKQKPEWQVAAEMLLEAVEAAVR